MARSKLHRSALLSVLSLCIFMVASAHAADAHVSVTFDAAAGAFADGNRQVVLEGTPGSELALPDAPSLAGQVFGGWYAQVNGGGEPLNPPYQVPQQPETYFAWWVPLAQTQQISVKVVWLDSAQTKPGDLGYHYNFATAQGAGNYLLAIDGLVDLDARSQFSVFSDTINVPLQAPDGSALVYEVDLSRDYGFFEREGMYYTASHQESGLPGQSTYINRTRLLRRALHPFVTVQHDGEQTEVRFTLTINPTAPGLNPAEGIATVSLNGGAQQVNLFELFHAYRKDMRDFALEETTHALDTLGGNQFSLSAEDIDGYNCQVTGDALTGWLVSYVKK